MDITFLGAARSTTGSMHLINLDGQRLLLDCGIFQGHRKEAFERNRNLPFAPESIDAVLLSHAHIDHSGNLPTLVQNGFRGPIYATAATKDLCDIMLRDSAFLQCKDVEHVNRKRVRQGKKPFEPLYRPEHIDQVMKHFEPVPYGEDFRPVPGAVARFNDAGHLLGSSITTIDFSTSPTSKRLLYTGDMGRNDQVILRDPVVIHDVHWLLTESTYGNRRHPVRADVQGRLKAFVEDISMQRSRLIIPAFSVGRTQLIIYYLRELYTSGRVPEVPVYVDSPLSSRATEVYENHEECYDADALRVMIRGQEPFQFKALHYTESVKDSKSLNDMRGPVIIISASGMCEGGRILHHLAHGLGDPRNIVLFVGYQAENTLGRRLIEHVSPAKIFGDEYQVNARIHTINALSAHADRDELLDYFHAMGAGVEQAFVVHGEQEQAKSLAGDLRRLGIPQVLVPKRTEKVQLQ